MRNWFTFSRVCGVIVAVLLVAGIILALTTGESVNVVSFVCVSLVAIDQIILNIWG